MAITIDDFSKIWASTSPLTPYAFSENNYKEGWNFIGGTPPSRQMWDFLQKQNDEKLKYLLDNFNDYLPLSGGTMTGAIKGNPVTLTADDGNNTSSLVLGADGSLALDGKSLSNVPDLSVFADTSDFIAPTVFSNRVNNANGGYKKVGNIVYVNVTFLPNALGSAGIWNLFSGFPASNKTYPMSFYAYLGDNVNSSKFVWAMITSGGFLAMATSTSVSADTDIINHSICVQGYYYSAQ